MWSARGLLENRLCWRVGSGRDISILHDAWLPGSPSYRISEQVSLGDRTRVADFIDNVNMIWDENLVIDTFSEEDARGIL